MGEGSATTPTAQSTRPSSTLSSKRLHLDESETAIRKTPEPLSAQSTSTATQTLTTIPVSINYEFSPTTTTQPISYSVGIQTTDSWSPPQPARSTENFSEEDDDQFFSPARTPKATKRLSRREREREEELRQQIRREIEEDLKSLKVPPKNGPPSQDDHRYPARALSGEEMDAVTSSDDFMQFVERSSKVIEKALEQEYDILADYAQDGLNGLDDDEDEGYASSRGKKNRRIKEIAQFYDERWSKKRMISDIDFSPKVILTLKGPAICTNKTSSFPNSF